MIFLPQAHSAKRACTESQTANYKRLNSPYGRLNLQGVLAFKVVVLNTMKTQSTDLPKALALSELFHAALCGFQYYEWLSLLAFVEAIPSFQLNNLIC